MRCADAKVVQARSRIHILIEKVKQAEYCPSTGVRVIQGVSWAEAKWFKKRRETLNLVMNPVGTATRRQQLLSCARRGPIKEELREKTCLTNRCPDPGSARSLSSSLIVVVVNEAKVRQQWVIQPSPYLYLHSDKAS